MKQIAESLVSKVGKTYDKSDVKVMIKKIQTEKLEKAGYKNILDKCISDLTLRNYSALLADEGNIAMSQSYISKSNTCYAAENSIRGSIATLGVIAATHFISVEEEDADIHAEMKTLPKSTWKLHDIVTDFFGTACIRLLRQPRDAARQEGVLILDEKVNYFRVVVGRRKGFAREHQNGFYET
jgi:hypothetical protein